MDTALITLEKPVTTNVCIRKNPIQYAKLQIHLKPLSITRTHLGWSMLGVSVTIEIFNNSPPFAKQKNSK